MPRVNGGVRTVLIIASKCSLPRRASKSALRAPTKPLMIPSIAESMLTAKPHKAE